MNQRTKELLRRNNKLDKLVEDENRETFTDMICYLRGADISEYNQELVRHDLLDMILSAQKRGESVRSVIGGDYKAFCDSVIESLPPQTIRQKTISFLDMICMCLSVLIAIYIVFSDEAGVLVSNLILHKPLEFEMAVSVGDMISVVVIIMMAIVIVSYFTKYSFAQSNKRKKLITGFALSSMGVLLVLFVTRLGQAALFKVNIFAVALTVIALYVVHKVLERM